MIASEDRVRKALEYLATTDSEAANAKALVEGLSDGRKTVKALLFMDNAQKTDKAREAFSYSHPTYVEHVEKLQNAIADYESLRNKRITEALIVEVWRTEQANRRAGNIT